MRRIFGTHRSPVVPVLLYLAALVPLWAQTPDPETPPASSQPSAPKPRVQKPVGDGAWHHFGESRSAPSTEPSQSGGWHRFAAGSGAPPPHQVPAPRNLGLNRTGDMEHLMLDLVNRDRADSANAAETKGRAEPLRWNDRLAAVARAHSLEMLNQGYFGHQDPQGRSVAGRVEAAGMEWQEVGENIAIYTTVARAEAAFMNEPRFAKNHRGNILDPGFTDVGIGIVQAPDGKIYITQDFYTALPHQGAR